MRKIRPYLQWKVILSIVLLMALSGCGGPTSPTQPPSPPSTPTAIDDQPDIKVIDISNAGSTKGDIFEQTKFFHNCAQVTQTGSIEFSTSVTQAEENEWTFSGGAGAEVSIPEMAKITLEAKVQNSLKNILEQTRGHTEKIEVTIAPFSNIEYKVVWHEVLYKGKILYEEDRQKKTADYTYRIGFEFESSEVKDAGCPNAVATSPAKGPETAVEPKWELKTKLQGHSSGVFNARFSPNGGMLVTSSDDRTARVWDTSTWQTIAVLNHDQGIWDAVFSPDNRLVATASGDGKARIWEARTGSMLAECANNGNVWRVDFSPDGRYLATAGGEPGFFVRVWDTQTCALKAELAEHQGNVWTAAFSPDGKTILSASSDKTARLWNWQSGTSIILSGHTDWVPFATFSKDGSLVLTVDADKTAKLWEAKTGQLISTLEGHGDIIWGGSFSPDGKMVATASGDNTARLWEVPSGKMLQTLFGHTGGVTNAIFSPDGRFLGTASVDGTAQVFNLKTGKAARLTGHTNRLFNIAFSPDSKYFVTTSADSTIQVWALSQ